MDAPQPRIVMETISPSRRLFHVNGKFNCELDNVILGERIGELQRSFDEAPEYENPVERIVDFMKNTSPNCSLHDALDTLSDCRHSHDCLNGIVEVGINLAKQEWPIIQQAVIQLLCLNIGWDERNVDVSMV